MVDRQDIDALLISALYGELTPADEARLQTHLDSHPADRTALADLTFARNAVRESRILTVQLEPPQAVSAMLLQEAARRAPKPAPVREREKEEGWFQRFVRSFVAHPAMAAAAMLVLVLGVAGTLYMRGDHVAEHRLPAANEPAMAVDQAEGAGKDQLAQESDELKLQAGSAYEATLSDDKTAAATPPSDSPEPKLAKGGKADEKPTEPAKKSPARRAGDTYVAVPKTEARPMDFEGDGRRLEKETATARQDLDRGGGESGRRFGVSGTGSAGISTKPDPAPAPTTAQASPDNQNRPRSTPPSVTPPPPSAPGTGGSIAEESKNDATTNNNEDATWAKDVHGKVVAAVKANNCREATNLAVSLESRAPGYYAQNVQNDRQLKQCVAYINAEREREAERVQRARAQQRRNADEPAPKAAKPAASPSTTKH